MRGVDEHNIDDIGKVPVQAQKVWHYEVEARKAIADLKANGPKESPVVNDRLILREHQQLGREIAHIRDRYCFFFDTRTGKTPLSLAIINDDLQEHPEHKWLIICPLILIENAWMLDASQFMPDIRIVNCHAATKAKRLKAIEEEANVYVTNIESFAAYQEYFEAKGFHGCIVDESSVLKSYKSKQSKAVVSFAQTVQRMYLLSGTPAPNGLWEYYSQLKAIDQYCVPASWTRFKEHFFIDVSFSQFEQLQLRADRKEEFDKLLSDYAIYVDKEDVLQLPGRTFIEVPLQLPDELKRHYTTLKNDLYASVVVDGEEKKLTAPSAAAKLNKLNQLTSGFLIDTQAVKENAFYGEEQKEVYLFSAYRFDRLAAILNMHKDTQVLIWANYREEFARIAEMLGDKCGLVYGGVSLAEKTAAIQGFKRGDLQYLVANPASADKGLTLTNCHICVYFSLNWSYELYKQSADRIYADISKQPMHCIYYVLLAERTIDEVLYRDVLQNKGDASAAVLRHLKPGGDRSANERLPENCTSY